MMMMMMMMNRDQREGERWGRTNAAVVGAGEGDDDVAGVLDGGKDRDIVLVEDGGREKGGLVAEELRTVGAEVREVEGGELLKAGPLVLRNDIPLLGLSQVQHVDAEQIHVFCVPCKHRLPHAKVEVGRGHSLELVGETAAEKGVETGDVPVFFMAVGQSSSHICSVEGRVKASCLPELPLLLLFRKRGYTTGSVVGQTLEVADLHRLGLEVGLLEGALYPLQHLLYRAGDFHGIEHLLDVFPCGLPRVWGRDLGQSIAQTFRLDLLDELLEPSIELFLCRPKVRHPISLLLTLHYPSS